MTESKIQTEAMIEIKYTVPLWLRIIGLFRAHKAVNLPLSMFIEAAERNKKEN